MKLTAKNIRELCYPKIYAPEGEQSNHRINPHIHQNRWDELIERNKSALYPSVYVFEDTFVYDEDKTNHYFIINGVCVQGVFHKLTDDIEWKLCGYYDGGDLEKIKPNLSSGDDGFFFTEFDNCSLVTKAEIKKEMERFEKTHMRRIHDEFKDEFSTQWLNLYLVQKEEFSIELKFGSFKIVYDIDQYESMLWDNYDHLFDRIYESARLMFQNRDLLRI